MKHFISLKHFSKKTLLELIKQSLEIKNKPSLYRNKLKGKTVGLLFQKPSLRTKTAFYVGALQLGANVIYYSPEEVKLGERESIGDAAETLSRYLDMIVLRTFSHQIVDEFAKHSAIPVINGLSDLLHPSQVLGDLVTLYELKRDLQKIKIAFIGDGNNVCHTFLYAISILGGNLHIATPKEYQPNQNIISECIERAKQSGANIYLSNNAMQAALDADVLYTDVWVSMGKENEADKRREIFSNFKIDDNILELAKKDCLVMHCLPAHRGEEITDSVMGSKNSVVFLQAENRLHSAKAILLYCIQVIRLCRNVHLSM